MEVPETFTARQAARYSKLTPYMVNYLCRAGVLEPSGNSHRGRGKWRAYTFGDVVILRALKRLLDSGISVARLKKGLENLRRHHPEITPKSVPRQYLVTDGIKVFFRTKGKVLETLDETGQFAFAFVVELKQVRAEVIEAIRTGSV